MKKLILLYLFGLTVVVSIFGQKTAQVQYAFKNFDGLVVSSSYDVYVKKGDQYSVVITVDAEHAERIQASVNNGVLYLGAKSGLFKNIKTLKAHITMPRLSSVVLSGSSDLVSNDVFVVENFKAVASGSSDMNVNIRAEKTDITTSNASDLKMNIETTELTLTSTGGSDSKLTGKAVNVSLTTSGGSDIDAGNLTAHHVTIVASGGSDVKVHAEKTLTVTASGASDVVYSGNPDVNTNTSGASSVKKRK